MCVNESMRVPGHSKPREIRTRAVRACIYNSNGKSSVPEAWSRVARTPSSRTWGTSRGYMLHTKWPWPSHTKSQLLLLSGTGVTDSDLLEALWDLLEGMAAKWARLEKHKWQSWNDFVTDFREHYGDPIFRFVYNMKRGCGHKGKVNR